MNRLQAKEGKRKNKNKTPLPVEQQGRQEEEEAASVRPTSKAVSAFSSHPLFLKLLSPESAATASFFLEGGPRALPRKNKRKKPLHRV